jgi:NAD(P)-dependent dehydrogenase (short-subunit alcohol dehydrogenase family)
MTESTSLRYALVTGGGSGLGREFCLYLARQGWQVCVTDIDLLGAEETLAGVLKLGGQGYVELLDVTNAAHWQLLVAKLRARWPRLDLLVNNAGICGAGKIGEYSLSEFHRIVEVNLMGVVHGCHAVVPWLLDTAPGGHITNIASIAPSLNAPTMSAYNSAKAGVISLSETLYGELLTCGIGVTVVIPGFFQSQLLESGTFDDERLRKLAECYSTNSTFTGADVVERTMKGIRRGQLHVVIGRRARIVWWLKRFAPRLFQRYVIWSFDRETRQNRLDG